MKILQIIPSLQSGGAERGCIEVANGLSDIGYPNHIITQETGPNTVLPSLTQLHFAPVASKNPIQILRNAALIHRIVVDHNIDLIHIRSRAPAWSIQLIKQKLHIPILSTCHGCYRVPNRLKHIYNRSITDYPDHIIAPSAYVLDYLQQHYPNSVTKTTVINRGVDLNVFQTKATDKKQQALLIKTLGLNSHQPILFVPARFTKFKGQSTVISAISRMKDLPVQVVFCGKIQDKSYFNQLKKQAYHEGVAHQVQLLPPIEDLPTAYSIADITICPSMTQESFGRIPIEAAAMGSIALASNHSGFKHTVLPNKTGFLFDANSPDDLSRKIRHILTLSTNDKRSIIDQATRRVHQEFTKDTMVKKTLNVYRNLLAQAKEPLA